MLDTLSHELGHHGGSIHFWMRLILLFFFKRGNTKALACIRLGQHFHRTNRPFLAKRMAVSLRREFGCIVNFDAEIGPGLRLPHPLGIVIGEGVRIGARCTIYQQVTIGGARPGDWHASRYPEIGDDVVLFTGAKLLGAITIGAGATVGANAVALRDIPAGYVAVGVPAVSKPGRGPDGWSGVRPIIPTEALAGQRTAGQGQRTHRHIAASEPQAPAG